MRIAQVTVCDSGLYRTCYMRSQADANTGQRLEDPSVQLLLLYRVAALVHVPRDVPCRTVTLLEHRFHVIWNAQVHTPASPQPRLGSISKLLPATDAARASTAEDPKGSELDEINLL